MENKPSPQLPPPNPHTSQKHAQETFWQILLPVLVGAILVVVSAMLIVGYTPAQASAGADASVIILILPLLFLGMIGLSILIVLIVLVTRVLQTLPPYAHLLQDNIEGVAGRIQHILDLSVEPILRFHSLRAMIQHIFRNQ